MLPPTTETLQEPDRVPYFAWDLGKTVREIHEILARGDHDDRDEVVVRLLREANSRDVWSFLGWDDIEEAWPRIEHRLGRARGVWRLMRERHMEVQQQRANEDDGHRQAR